MTTRGSLVDAGGLELALGGVEHRLEVSEVRRGGHHLGGDDDLLVVGDGLCVVALQEPATARALDQARVQVGGVDLALRRGRWRVGIRSAAEAPPVLRAPRPVALIGLVGANLGPQFFVEAALGFLEALGAVARNRPGLLGALLFEAALGLAQPRAPALAGAQLLGQLVAARVAVELVLGGIDRLGLFEDLARELLVVAVGVATGVRRNLGPVDRDDADLGQALLGAQRQDLAEQPGDRVLVALDEPRDRRVIGPLLRGQHPEGDVLLAARSITRDDRIPRA